jgi:hypothetical protein
VGWEERLAVKIETSIRPREGLGANKEAKLPEERRRTKDQFGRHANPKLRGSAPEKSTQVAACEAIARTSFPRHARPPWLIGVHHGNLTFALRVTSTRPLKSAPAAGRVHGKREQG